MTYVALEIPSFLSSSFHVFHVLSLSRVRDASHSTVGEQGVLLWEDQALLTAFRSAFDGGEIASQ